MTQFRKFNLIAGWAVFIIATVTYALTIEPTTSLWDCGEFIASAYKLEVGHPPGAPVFMIVAKVFSLLSFGDVTQVAKMMNMLSALSSSFTILFLFWTITHLARKIMKKISNLDELKMPQLIAVIGSGAVGALAYTFSDTFWFSAVESEVYAMSSLFTAVVFWAILKWENIAHEKYADRWIVLIAFLMGLSIGVHLLNLLAIPAIALVYYFKKYKVTPLGIVLTIAISFITLLVVMYGIIQGLVLFASKFELMFVNNFGLPFNSGFVFYLITLIVLVSLGLFLTHKYKKPLLNTIVLSFTVIIIGYSSFALVVIRSSANPPMDENNPENAFSLKSYLNREQYGNRPLISGQYYNAEAVDRIDNYTYIQGKEKYIEIKKTNPTYKYEKANSTLFPRMYSSDPNHVKAYKTWGNVKTKPNMANNILFFLKYQIGHMYFRYFMWNFAGRQNDIQGHGGYQKGNWISGFTILDSFRLGSQKNITDEIRDHSARNKLFLLPLILGLMGIVISYSGNKKDFWVIMTLFLMTGLAIVVYLNQTPYQPRERDYAYAGSFYAFTIWIGLSVLALYDIFRRIKQLDKQPLVRSALAVGIAILVPVLMAAQNWDDHDRSGRYTARDMAANYLNSCAPNAILFTYGDNDTFPLWYAQEVEGIRTDVRVVNLSLLSTDWYIDQMRMKAYESEVLPISLTPEQYMQGKRDYTLLYDAEQFLFNEKYNANKKQLSPIYEDLFNRFMQILKNSTFPENHKSDMVKMEKGHASFSVIKFVQFVDMLSDKKNITKYKLDKEKIAQIKTESEQFLTIVSKSPTPLDAIIKFVASDSQDTKLGYGDEQYDFIPTHSFIYPVNKERVLADGVLHKQNEDKMLDNITWSLGKKKQGLYKSQLIILDILAHNNWERPIYFASSVGNDNYLGLTKYFRLEGFAYRIIPFVEENMEQGIIGSINSDILYDNLMNKFTWGGLEKEGFHVDHYVDRVISIMDIRDVFHRLARTLILEEKNDKALEVLDRCIEVVPHVNKPYDISALPLVEDYYLLGEFDKGNQISLLMFDFYKQNLDYYSSLSGDKASDVDMDKRYAIYVINQLIAYADEYKQKKIVEKMMPTFQKYGAMMQMFE